MTFPSPVDVPEPQTVEDPEATEPRTRWAAVIWGSAFLLVAFAGFVCMVLPEARTLFAHWLSTFTRTSLAAYSVLAVGLLALTIGLVVLARRAQRSAAARRSRQQP